MAYDEELADRVRELVAASPGMSEKRMFGGLAMLHNGRMAVVISGAVACSCGSTRAQEDKALTEPGAARAIMRG